MPTYEDIIRDLLHQYTDQVHPRVSIATGVAARQRHLDRRPPVPARPAGHSRSSF
jgi:hypothetical protein